MAPDELKKFVEAAGNKLIVVDARNPDFNTEPGNKFSIPYSEFNFVCNMALTCE
jgi:hypothetical protein